LNFQRERFVRGKARPTSLPETTQEQACADEQHNAMAT
jgi:hypothetical protein